MDLARQTADEVERERLMQTAEHYGRIVNAEQGKIDSTRDPKDKTSIVEEQTDAVETIDSSEEEDMTFPDFITNEK